MIFFKFPFKPEIYSVQGSSGQTAVKFVSFDEHETVEFSGTVTEISDVDFSKVVFPIVNVKPPEFQIFKEEGEIEYKQKVEQVINFVRENNIPKLVLSRQKYLPYSSLSESGQIDFLRSFQNLYSSYPNAFAYIFNEGGKAWMGAFSELLGRFNKKTSLFETMSLAGTLPLNEEWTEKEIEEQKPVSLYIANILEKYSSSVQISDTYDHHSGNIKHLRNDFKALISEDDLSALITELHPTPAVCGIPKEFCREAIATFEKHPRSLYAGYIQIETEAEIQYFVNLRCARLTEMGAHLYVGGGINSKSDPEKEWQETELKAAAILQNLMTTDAT